MATTAAMKWADAEMEWIAAADAAERAEAAADAAAEADPEACEHPDMQYRETATFPGWAWVCTACGHRDY